jgi:2,3-bisphosphoglycerate-dependent phosphoglycerate mutase
MEATRILAIRHGETAWNVDTRIQGQLDIGLNDTGRWQAQRTAQALAHEDIAAIYSSDLSRAFETAQTIASALSVRGALQVISHLGLRERHFGHFQGKTWAEIETHWPDDALRWRQRDPTWSPIEGESLLQLRERIAQCVHELAQQHTGEQIVLVAHGGVMDVLYRLATGQSTQAPRTWHLGNAAINRLLWTPQGLSLVGWGDVSHFEDADHHDSNSKPRDESTA